MSTRSDKEGQGTLKRFVSWAAVSSEPQVEKVSLQDQLRTNRTHVERHGGILVEELVVPGKSRSIILFEDAARRIEAYARLKQLIDQRAFDVLIFLDRSRLGRKASLSMAVVELCHEAGIQTYETENPPARLDGAHSGEDEMLIGAIKSVGAQREVQKIKERRRMGMTGRVQRGGFPAAVGYGWTVRYASTGKKTIDLHPEHAAVVRLALVDLFLERGWGMMQIAEELNRRSHPAPEGGRWIKSCVRSLLNRAHRFAGWSELRLPGQPVVRGRGQWPAILTDDEADAVVAERARRKAARRTVGSMRLFSGCTWCRVCNRRMQVSSGLSSRRNQFIVALRCQTPHTGANISEKKLRAAAQAAIQYLFDAANLEAVLSTYVPNADAIRVEIAAKQDAIKQVKTAQNRADDAFVAGVMPQERYQRQIDRLKAQLASLEDEIDVLHEALRAERTHSTRGDRLQEIVREGLAVLDHDDVQLANAWMRRHFRFWVGGSQVVEVEYL